MEEKTYRIGEAAELLNLKTYVLRFWETEFPQLDPLRTEKGQRLYSERDIAVLRRIRHLLHERGLTIEGARRILAEEGGHAAAEPLPVVAPDSADTTPAVAASCDCGGVVRDIVAELEQLRRLLAGPS